MARNGGRHSSSGVKRCCRKSDAHRSCGGLPSQRHFLERKRGCDAAKENSLLAGTVKLGLTPLQLQPQQQPERPRLGGCCPYCRMFRVPSHQSPGSWRSRPQSDSAREVSRAAQCLAVAAAAAQADTEGAASDTAVPTDLEAAESDSEVSGAAAGTSLLPPGSYLRLPGPSRQRTCISETCRQWGSPLMMAWKPRPLALPGCQAGQA